MTHRTMTHREMSTLETSGLLFLGGFLLMSVLAAVGTVGGGSGPRRRRGIRGGGVGPIGE